MEDTSGRTLTQEEKKELNRADIHKNVCELECARVFMSKKEFSDGVIKAQNKIIWCFVGMISVFSLIGWQIRGSVERTIQPISLMQQSTRDMTESCKEIRGMVDQYVKDIDEYKKTQFIIEADVKHLKEVIKR